MRDWAPWVIYLVTLAVLVGIMYDWRREMWEAGLVREEARALRQAVGTMQAECGHVGTALGALDADLRASWPELGVGARLRALEQALRR